MPEETPGIDTSQYPNIAMVLDNMPEDYRTMAALYFGMIPPDTVQAIEGAIPQFIEAYEEGDTDRVQELAESIGCGEIGPQLTALMVGANDNAIA